MCELKEIKSEPKTGHEYMSYNGLSINYSLLDFWQWSVSDLLSNATRGRFAEFIVATAIGINPTNIRKEWDAYDIKSTDGIKIEVKSAAYIQSWYQRKFSSISFSIRPTKFWDASNNIYKGKIKRHADIYVFCHLKHKDQNTIDPLKMEQWDFYVLPTFIIDNYKKSQNSITLNSLRKFTKQIKYDNLYNKIHDEYSKLKKYSK